MNHDSFTETGANSMNQYIESDSKHAATARVGLALEGSIDKLNWNASIEHNLIIKGEESEMESSFAGTNLKFRTRGAETGKHVLGLSGNINYKLNKDWDVYANTDFRFGDDYKSAYGGVGIRYSFCNKSKKKTPSLVVEKPIRQIPTQSQAAEMTSVAPMPLAQPVAATAVSVPPDPATAIATTTPTAAPIDAPTPLTPMTAPPHPAAATPAAAPAHTGARLGVPIVAVAADTSKAKAPKRIATPLYAFDSSVLTKESKQMLDEAAKKIRSDTAVVLVGHADSTGARAYNQKLSERRAKSAYEYLNSLGIEERRMSYIGRGEDEPIADNKTRAGRAKNRRVEVELYE